MSSRLSAKAGLAIRKLRLAGGWTLAQLSERSGVPLSTLSKVELGQTSLSYENLLRICKGLEIDMARLIRAEAEGVVGEVHPTTTPGKSGRRSVTRAGAGAAVRMAAGPVRAQAADLARKAFSPIVCDVEAETLEDHGGLTVHDAEAFIQILEGEATVHCEGARKTVLAEGDSLYFDARAGYAVLNSGRGPCRILLVIAGDGHV